MPASSSRTPCARCSRSGLRRARPRHQQRRFGRLPGHGGPARGGAAGRPRRARRDGLRHRHGHRDRRQPQAVDPRRSLPRRHLGAPRPRAQRRQRARARRPAGRQRGRARLPADLPRHRLRRRPPCPARRQARRSPGGSARCPIARPRSPSDGAGRARPQARDAPAGGFFERSLERDDPELAAALGAGARAPAEPDRADRVGEHRQPGGARRPGLGADQQVRRGLSRPALLRRLRVRRRRRGARDRARASSCSAAASPTSSRTAARRPTSRRSWRSRRPATPCSACRSPPAAT